MSTLLSFENVSLGYGRKVILRDLNFELHPGDYVAIVGANGAGKSTLLKGILGNLKPLAGRVQSPHRLHYGYVPQLQTVDEIFPITVQEVVLMGRFGRMGFGRRPQPADSQAAKAALEETGISDLAERLYRDLSGGQKQRALIARALATEPDILVLDEHTNDLDIVGERSIMELVDRLHAQKKLTIVMVSHSLNVIANHARRVGLIRESNCRFEPIDTVLTSAFLSDFYGVSLHVAEVEGRKVVA